MNFPQSVAHLELSVITYATTHTPENVEEYLKKGKKLVLEKAELLVNFYEETEPKAEHQRKHGTTTIFN